MPAVIVLCALACVVVLATHQRRAALSLWLIVAMLAVGLDAMLNMTAARFSYAWDMGKIITVFKASVVPHHDPWGHRAAVQSARQRGSHRRLNVVVLPRTDQAGVQAIAERIRASVENLAISYLGEPIDGVTVSIGIAFVSDARGIHETELLEAADGALYAAKKSGRTALSSARSTRSGRYEYMPTRR